MKRAVIIQCRLSSSRLPEKALYDLDGSPILSWTLRAMKKVRADKYYVATDEESFDALLPICKQEGFECFAGPLENVLERYCLLIKKIKADTIIRATADNPFLFYEAAQKSADDFDSWRGTKKECDYFTLTGLPHGSGVEVFDGNALLKAAEQTKDLYDREHVGPALYNHKDKFRCLFVEAPSKFRASELRTTIDTYQDYLRAMAICNAHELLKTKNDNSKTDDSSVENKKSVFKFGKKSGLFNRKNDVPEPYTTEEILEACNSKAAKSPLVLIPSVKAGQGTGHLVRCLKIAREIFGFIYIPKEALSLGKENSKNESSETDSKKENLSDEFLKETSSLVEEAIKEGLNPNRIISELPDDSFRPVFVCDMMSIPHDVAVDLSNRGTLVGIDDGSDNDELFDYILDIIPSIREREIINLKNINFIDFPKNRRSFHNVKIIEEVSTILIAFGGEDPAGLTEDVLKKCREIFPNAKITIVSKKEIQTQGKEKLVSSIPNLKEELHKYDLVFTHYGLTALECVAAGVGVILLPTTPLHGRLSEKYGFANTTLENLTKTNINMIFESGKLYPKIILNEIAGNGKDSSSGNVTQAETSLSSFIKKLSLGTKYFCPVCRTAKNDSVVSRNYLRTYRRCSECGMVYISWSGEEEQKYEKEYFFESYKNQYGKTYKEDFDSIKQSCKKRVAVMNQIFRLNLGSKDFRENPAVLDIGCAYGPFLKAASESGWQPFGTDICDDAVESVQKELRFPACTSAFPEINTESEFGVRDFDAVTMWYVIEHFQDLDSVLKKVSSLLKTGGVFAFSTPSGEGVSAKSNLHEFYKKSPIDHFSVWEPSRANKILKKYGFRVVRIVSTGHHPERFPSVKKRESKQGSLHWRMINKYSRFMSLGDTVEIYCIKK